MKNLLTKSGKNLTVIMLMCLSINAFAGDHVTMYASKCVQTGPTSLTIDLYVVNDGTTNLQLNALNYGLNVDAAILNGGAASWVLVPGTSDLPSSVTRTFTYGYSPAVHQLRLASSNGSVSSTTAPSMEIGKPVHVGTFTITNSTQLANKTGNLDLQAATGRGLTNTGVVVYSNGASTVTNLNITGTNRNIGQRIVLAVNSTPDVTTSGKMEAYPNPAHDKLNVAFSSNKNDNYLLQVVDVSGRMVINKSDVIAQKGNNLVELDITNFAAGNYTLSLIAADGSKQETKIVVK